MSHFFPFWHSLLLTFLRTHAPWAFQPCASQDLMVLPSLACPLALQMQWTPFSHLATSLSSGREGFSAPAHSFASFVPFLNRKVCPVPDIGDLRVESWSGLESLCLPSKLYASLGQNPHPLCGQRRDAQTPCQDAHCRGTMQRSLEKTSIWWVCEHMET